MEEDRENGLYWVIKRSIHPDWLVAHWYNNTKLWKILDLKPHYVYSSEIDNVGPQILPPKKKEPVERKDGFYWIKRREGDKWKPAILNEPGNYACQWNILGCDEGFEDHEFYKIGPRLSPPEGEG